MIHECGRYELVILVCLLMKRFTANKEDLTVADIMERTAYTKNNVKDFVAGGVGGIFQLLTGHPLDTMKVISVLFCSSCRNEEISCLHF